MSALTEAAVSQPVADLEQESALGSFPEGVRLVGTECNECSCAMIGSRIVCSSCVSRDVTRIALPRTGGLYSFTRIHVGNDAARPMGYVDLDNGVRTLADLREGTDPLRPDMRVELGVEGDTWFFTPVAGALREDHHE